MKCPHCNVNLLIYEKQGVELDYCPECRGVWLDRGELEKIIERSNSNYGDSHKNQTYKIDHHEEKKYHHDNNHYENKKHKKGSFLSEIFDF